MRAELDRSTTPRQLSAGTDPKSLAKRVNKEIRQRWAFVRCGFFRLATRVGKFYGERQRRSAQLSRLKPIS